MLAAPSIDLTLLPPPRKARWAPVVLSALVHLLVLLAWLGFPVPEGKPAEERAFQVELAAEPPRPPAKATGATGQPASPSATEQGMPIPQLEDGMLAQRSSTPRLKADDKPVVAPPEPRTEIAPKPKKPEPVTQNERDFVLGQVLRNWHPPRELVAYDKADVRVTVTVRADGYFADIYDGRLPWNPGAVFDGYAGLAPDSIQRRTVDAFYRAIRQAQPVRLPPALKAKAPFPVRLDFRFKDAR